MAHEGLRPLDLSPTQGAILPILTTTGAARLSTVFTPFHQPGPTWPPAEGIALLQRAIAELGRGGQVLDPRDPPPAAGSQATPHWDRFRWYDARPARDCPT